MIETVGLLAGSGWAAGLNLYLATLMLGILGRLGWGDVPQVLTRVDVMVVAGVLFVVEFAVDKIPFLDNVWDAIHTFVRPIGAAALGRWWRGRRRRSGRPSEAWSQRSSPRTLT